MAEKIIEKYDVPGLNFLRVEITSDGRFYQGYVGGCRYDIEDASPNGLRSVRDGTAAEVVEQLVRTIKEANKSLREIRANGLEKYTEKVNADEAVTISE